MNPNILNPENSPDVNEFFVSVLFGFFIHTFSFSCNCELKIGISW